MFTVEATEEVLSALEALPRATLLAYAEVQALLETAPLSGRLTSPHRPEANFRAIPFGPSMGGMLIYFVLEDERRVIIVRILWAG